MVCPKPSSGTRIFVVHERQISNTLYSTCPQVPLWHRQRTKPSQLSGLRGAASTSCTSCSFAHATACGACFARRFTRRQFANDLECFQAGAAGYLFSSPTSCKLLMYEDLERCVRRLFYFVVMSHVKFLAHGVGIQGLAGLLT